MSEKLINHEKIELLNIIYRSNAVTSATSIETIKEHYENAIKLVEKKD